MSITRAQQARQLYKNGKRVGLFRGAQADASAGRGSMSPGTSGGGGSRSGGYGRDQGNQGDQQGDMSIKDFDPNMPNPDGSATYKFIEPPKKPKKTKDNFKKPNIIQNYFENSLFTKGLQALKNSRLAQLNSQKQREDYLNNLQITNPELYQETIDDLEKLGYYNPDPVEYYGPESKGAARDIEQFPDLYEDQAKSILNTVRDNFDDEGTATVGTLYDDYLDSRNTPTGGGGGDDQVIDPCKGPNPPAYCFVGDDTEEEVNPRDYTGIAPRFMGSSFDFTGLAEGGIARTGAMDGGRMRQMEMMEDEDDPTGGIMDLESGRQMYFLGKLVKKAGRAIKKVVKSPIGKAALLYGLGSLGAGALGKYNAGTGSGFFSGLKGKLFGKAALGAKSVPGMGSLFKPATKGLLGKLGITKGAGSFMPTLKGGIGLGLGIPFALDALGVGKDGDDGMDLDEYYKTQGIDIDAIRNNPNRILARRFMAEGGDAEPVAKKTMPLLDMDGMEKDYREDGGFVPIGRMERADDVPARLSKNEFVFTADAVRNAGEGDIDKGAEVMYNMMKNLESGGEVSEESQGLDGAKEMFQTSQRLEEVL